MIRWGVIGPGSIATGFAEAMQWAGGGTITAVASRAAERAEAFGDRFDIATRYGDYAALAADPDVDVVYVATPHARHEVDTIGLLQAGKHVLCEKPLALNARQAGRMAEEARSRGLFLMEAIWSRFLPAYRSLVDIIGEGRIGEPLLVEADFGFRRPVDPSHRHFARELGGGALLDLGIYPIQLCTLILGPIERVVGDGVVGETGVDEVVTALLHHAGGRLGVVKAALRELAHPLERRRRRPHRRLVRGERSPLRDRRGAPVPGRGTDRERCRPPGRVRRAGHGARFHPGGTRRGVPGRVSGGPVLYRSR
jgi:predicted dehydrogenase